MPSLEIPVIGDLRSALYVLAVGVLLGWRFQRWIERHLSVIVRKAVKDQVGSDISAHTVQIALLQAKVQKHSRQIVQMVQAGENTVAAAAVWPKSPPSMKERENLFIDWRNILGPEEIDHKD